MPELTLEQVRALRAGLISVQSELEDMLRQDAPPSQDWLWQIHTDVSRTLYDTLPDTEARTRESVRRNAGTHRLLRELGD